jgi:hypothetical protein
VFDPTRRTKTRTRPTLPDKTGGPGPTRRAGDLCPTLSNPRVGRPSSGSTQPDGHPSREATREMISLDRSLKIIYQLIEKARRTNIEIQKLYDEEMRQNELFFYRKLIQQFLSQAKIKAMLTQYHSSRTRSRASSWNIHADSCPQTDYPSSASFSLFSINFHIVLC